MIKTLEEALKYISELEAENKMLKSDFLQYAGFDWSELERNVSDVLY